MPDTENVKSNKVNQEEQSSAGQAPASGGSQDGAGATSRPDEGQLKTVSAIGYLGILFLIPYLMFPKEKFAVFHANQGLILLIAGVAVSILGGAVPVIGWFLIAPIGSILILILLIIGILNAANGKMQRLPVIGGFDILKVQE